MACNEMSIENENFDSLDDSQITLMHPPIEAESPIRLFREKMELERQAMARNFAQMRDLIDTCERDFTQRFGNACTELEREIGERELQLRSIQQTLQEMSLSMKENSLLSTLQVAQQPLLTKLQQLQNEIAVLSDLKIRADMQNIEQSIRLLGALNNPIEELEFKDAVPVIENDQAPLVNGDIPPEAPNRINNVANQAANAIPYADRKNCVWASYKSDSSPEGVSNPRGVTVCQATGAIYLSDHGNHRIQVCTHDGAHLRSITHKDMSYPLYTVVGVNHNEIFVTSHYALMKFTIQGEFLAKCSVSRSAYRGIDKDEKGMIYACEWRNYIIVTHEPDNLKVVKRLKLQSADISHHRKLNDIKIVGDFFYVLFAHNGFWLNFSYREFPLQIYDKYGDHVRSLAGGQILQKPVCLAVDAEGNCLVSDYWKHTVMVVSPTGALLGSIGKSGQGIGELSYPTGLCLTREGTVLVVSTGKTDGMLQAF